MSFIWFLFKSPRSIVLFLFFSFFYIFNNFKRIHFHSSHLSHKFYHLIFTICYVCCLLWLDLEEGVGERVLKFWFVSSLSSSAKSASIGFSWDWGNGLLCFSTCCSVRHPGGVTSPASLCCGCCWLCFLGISRSWRQCKFKPKHWWRQAHNHEFLGEHFLVPSQFQTEWTNFSVMMGGTTDLLWRVLFLTSHQP